MLHLEFPEEKHEKQWEYMKKDWVGESAPSRAFFGDSYQELLDKVNQDIEHNDQGVNSHFFFLVDHQDHILGSIQIRHHIDHPVLGTIGGHIGYGIATRYRGKGYATQMLSLALDKIKQLGLHIDKVLITCNPDNHASARVIEKNGGIFEREEEYDGMIKSRYWIEL